MLNASAIHLSESCRLLGELAYRRFLGVVAVDGVPGITQKWALLKSRVLWEDHVGSWRPQGRVEFLFTGRLLAGKNATLITRSVNTGPGERE